MPARGWCSWRQPVGQECRKTACAVLRELWPALTQSIAAAPRRRCKCLPSPWLGRPRPTVGGVRSVFTGKSVQDPDGASPSWRGEREGVLRMLGGTKWWDRSAAQMRVQE